MMNITLPMAWSEESARAIFSTAMDDMIAWLVPRMAAPPPDLATRVFVAFSAARGAITMSLLVPERAPGDETLIAYLIATTRAQLGL